MHRNKHLLTFFKRAFFDDHVTLQPLATHGLETIRGYADDATVTIGDVSKTVTAAKRPELVPTKYLSMGSLSQQTLRHLRWMLQKDKLGQDMFLIGPPSATRRRLTLAFLEMTGREVEYIALSRDTTESDLKQRREIVSGTARYFHQSAVRAALEGRILVLEGIEKAERNVLPVLNNLLENREMHLEDGRFLIPASRYDNLLKEFSKAQLDQWNLLRVSEDFRVIALGLPVPKFVGNPLDPPLRSRFQARDVSPPSYQELLDDLRTSSPDSNPSQLSQLVSVAHTLNSPDSASIGLPPFPLDNIPLLGKILKQYGSIGNNELLTRLYPYSVMLNREGREAVKSVFEKFHVAFADDRIARVNKVETINGGDRVTVTVGNSSSTIEVVTGSFNQPPMQKYIETKGQETAVADLCISHTAGDMCLLGPRGCGKSAVATRLASVLKLELEPIVLYQDMSSRDLIQQRTTLANGDTVWQNSRLVEAALNGRLAVLEGINAVHPSTLAVLHRLVQDREMQLFDGRRLVRHDRYDELLNKTNGNSETLEKAGILKIHPAFRILAIADTSTPGVSVSKWLTGEMLSLFLFHEMKPMSLQEELSVIEGVCGKGGPKIEQLLTVAESIRTAQDPTVSGLSASFSTRQLLRIARRLTAFPNDSLYESVQKACLARFLPPLAKEALLNVLRGEGIAEDLNEVETDVQYSVTDDSVQIGNTRVPRFNTGFKSKVPDILFYDVPQHLKVLEWLLQDFALGEHLLLVGNQGVGKNKLADRLLQLLNRPREYIQLHRDTTVQTLTLQPNVRDGVVTYEDSPLVQAVKAGHVLVVDEADKAPTHVTCILKTLVERGEMSLSDGRKILPPGDPRCLTMDNVIPMHPDFRVIVLANRPGFPFLGNDFFAALGDLFSCHAVDNPSPESEIALLKQYGPDVPEHIILKLVRAFGELRKMADNGLVQYPYSTREVVNIVRHLQMYPEEGLSTVVKNVFDFDQYQKSVLDALIPVLEKHGIPMASVKTVQLSKEFPLPQLVKYGTWSAEKQMVEEIIEIEERSIKLGQSKQIPKTKAEVDRIEARSNQFTELQSYWSLPLPRTSVVHQMVVTKGDTAIDDIIHVLTINPSMLHSVHVGTGLVQIHNLHGYLPRLPYGEKPRFSMSVLDGSLKNNLCLVEQNRNSLFIINPQSSEITEVDTQSMSEKVTSTIGISSRSQVQVVNQCAPSNAIATFQPRGGNIEVINLEDGTCSRVELPLKLYSVQIVSDDVWLLQDVGGSKFLFEKISADENIPSKLTPLMEHGTADARLDAIVGSSPYELDAKTLSLLLGENISAPNRVLLSSSCFAAVVVGFPDLKHSNQDLYLWPRRWNQAHQQNTSVFLQNSNQIITPVSKSSAPSDIDGKVSGLAGFLEVLDLNRRSLRYIPLPERTDATSWYVDNQLGVFVAERTGEKVAVIDRLGTLRLFETVHAQLERSLDDWMKMVGSERKTLQLTIERDSGKSVSGPKHGKVDKKNEPHVGGNTWAGGSGGRDTAGLGGKGGPYRLDGGHNVHQISDAEKDDVPDAVKAAAREMGRRAFLQRLEEIRMSEYDHSLYLQYSDAVNKQVQALRVILDNVQAKAKERMWTRHQTTGDLDDLKLIEGVTGEKTIYRRRAEKEPEPGTPQTKPKRLRLVVDVSGSMYRFNGYDGRLDRMMEATVLVMEAFHGHESKFVYDIVGHSGEGYNHVFVEPGRQPSDNKERLNVIKTMHANSQFCMSGDNTLPATVNAIETLAQEDCDEAIVVILSDANLERYGIPPKRFGQALTSNPAVGAYAIFIGSLGDEADRLASLLPAGRSFVCMDLAKIPQILQQIFTSSVLNAT